MMDAKWLGIGLVIGIIIGVAGGYFAFSSSAPTQQMTTTKPMGTTVSGPTGGGIVTYTIGALFPITGALASTGKVMSDAANLAISDINKYLASIGSNVRFNITIVDTKTDPQTALTQLQTLAARGITVFIGPASSREVNTLKTYAYQNHLVVISPSSTSPLVVPHPNVYRVVGTDIHQGEALAYLMKYYGYTKAVIVYRNDDYGLAFAKRTQDVFSKLGGTSVLVAYDPNLTPQGASSVVQQIKSYVQQLGTTGVAIAIIAFDEIEYIAQNALQDPVLSSIRWFAGEGALDKIEEELSSTSAAAQAIANFYLKVNLTITTPAATSQRAQDFATRFQQVYGYAPTTYGYYTYDAVWIAALAILMAGSANGDAVNKTIPIVASQYYGVTGYKALDQNGDALYQDYTILLVSKVGNKIQTVEIGTYYGTTSTIEIKK
jgi:branched-chain amino acid transport system substrate-binding protein